MLYLVPINSYNPIVVNSFKYTKKSKNQKNDLRCKFWGITTPSLLEFNPNISRPPDPPKAEKADKNNKKALGLIVCTTNPKA
jgi:hypothetical protein